MQLFFHFFITFSTHGKPKFASIKQLSIKQANAEICFIKKLTKKQFGYYRTKCNFAQK